jgi:hypothetical protein
MTAPADPPDGRLSFAVDIKSLFRERDRQAMQSAFDLWSAEDVRTHGAAITSRLQAGTMPCDGVAGRPGGHVRSVAGRRGTRMTGEPARNGSRWPRPEAAWPAARATSSSAARHGIACLKP